MTANYSMFYRRWIIANGLAEAAGLGGTFVLGFLAAPILTSEKPAIIIISGLFAVVLGTIFEGVIVGAAQSIPLRKLVPEIESRSWIIATAIGAGIAWFVGMIPSTVMSLTSGKSDEGPQFEPSAFVQYGLATLLGLVAGPILGLAQWFVLRKHFSRADTWLLANAAAWAVGMPLIFLGMDFVPWDGPMISKSVAVVTLCGFVGVFVGTVHGWFLVRMVKASRAEMVNS